MASIRAAEQKTTSRSSTVSSTVNNLVNDEYKKISLLFATALLLGACNKNEVNTEIPEVPEVRISASIGNNDPDKQTKAGIDADKLDYKNGEKFFWENNDQIQIYQCRLPIDMGGNWPCGDTISSYRYKAVVPDGKHKDCLFSKVFNAGLTHLGENTLLYAFYPANDWHGADPKWVRGDNWGGWDQGNNKLYDGQLTVTMPTSWVKHHLMVSILTSGGDWKFVIPTKSSFKPDPFSNTETKLIPLAGEVTHKMTVELSPKMRAQVRATATVEGNYEFDVFVPMLPFTLYIGDFDTFGVSYHVEGKDDGFGGAKSVSMPFKIDLSRLPNLSGGTKAGYSYWFKPPVFDILAYQ